MELLKKNKTNLVWIIATITVSIIGHSPAFGLIIGLITACSLKNIDKTFINSMSKKLLQLAVVLLGFNLKFATLLEVGKNSIVITAVTITTVLIAGYFLGKLYKLDKKLSTLISSGTAICGGSAIAAVAPSINADPSQIAVSMGIVFVLNAIALFIFPPIGHFLHMTQEQFGLWAAIAIHDTSSVVGATVTYGAKAAAIGTTVKLTRALWVLPVAFVFSKVHNSNSKAKFPFFLICFMLASVISSYLPYFNNLWTTLAVFGKQLMVGILFLVGISLSPNDIRALGIKPFVAAVLLWLIIALASLSIIMNCNLASLI